MPVHLLGIRHHGPGSARSVVRELERVQPDCLLIEGPADAGHLLSLARADAMRPPVAILTRVPAERGVARFYPLAVFSPEWQAIRHGLARGVPVRFIDLPSTVALAEDVARHKRERDADDDSADDASVEDDALRADPIAWLAEAAGEEDPERWWERLVEERVDDAGVFEAIAEAMAAVREVAPEPSQPERRREAHMRQSIRAAEREGFERIAVVCGAFHVPALAARPAASADAELLRALPRVKVESTWIPWTHDRLAAETGYGAGVRSPGWYAQLWREPAAPQIPWMARCAALLREEDLDASPAQVVDAVRLADALCAVRERAVPGLLELTEATLSVLCQGDATPLALIRRKLVIGEETGELPPDAPIVPLQADLDALTRRLRLRRETGERRLELDLRRDAQLEQSHLLHRLRILDVPWGRLERSTGKGTFREAWMVAWRPELALSVIEASVWGSTVEEAATARSVDRTSNVTTVAEAASLLDAVLLADLPAAADACLRSLEDRSALSTDTGQLMDALPALSRVARYGNVRRTDAELVARMVDHFVRRIVTGLGAAGANLDDDAAESMTARIEGVDVALATAADDLRSEWRAALAAVVDRSTTHPLVAGRACRILVEGRVLEVDAAAARLSQAASPGMSAMQTAAWLEGFLRGSGMILLLEERLFGLVDDWLTGMRRDTFEEALPLLRRTVATFAAGERRQLGERVARPERAAGDEVAEGVDPARAERALAVVATLLGLDR